MNPDDGEFVQEGTGQPEPRLTQERALVRLAAIVAFALGRHLASYAQEPTFEVKCTVVDEMGAVIPHGEVELKGGPARRFHTQGQTAS